MTSETPTGRRVLGIGSMVAGMVAAILVLGSFLTPGEAHLDHPAAIPMARPAEPIRAEADVFRTRMVDLAVDPAAAARDGAKRRTLATYRALRAFPGAPPRIPHELSGREFREQRCLNCHERGGFSPRFGAYTPVTPHPQQVSCLQCHVVDGLARLLVANDWRTIPWPDTVPAALPEGPPPITHDFQMRENCLACHGGPAAVEEVRTPHPERANCRQCHVPVTTDETSFSRPLDASASRSPGGAR